MKLRILFSGLLVSMFLFTVVSAEVPKMINYQGKLTRPQGGLINATVSIIFTIYDDSTEGTVLWTETQDSIVVERSIFSVLLGSSNEIPDSVFDGSVRYLGITVGDDSEMTPRRTIVSVGYAYRSVFADTAKYAQVVVSDGDWTIDGDNLFRIKGNIGIGTGLPDQRLVIRDTVNLIGLGGAGGAQIGLGETGAGIMAVLSGENTGPGAAGSFLIQTGGTDGLAHNRMIITGEDGNVGIGTTNPDQKLTVDGNTHITGDLTVDGTISPFPLKVYDSGWFSVVNGGTYVKSHNLGTTKLLVQVFGAEDASGTGMALQCIGNQSHPEAGMAIQSITSTQLTVQCAQDHARALYGSEGQDNRSNNGYARVIALALE